MKREWEPGRGCGRPRDDAAVGRRIRRDDSPSRRETSRHLLGVSANATVRMARPCIQESSPGAGYEAHFVTGDGRAECFDLIPMPGFRASTARGPVPHSGLMPYLPPSPATR